VDSTGLKLCGAGEWLVEKHGTKTRRSWRKLHIGLDADTGQIVAAALTTKEVDDGSQVGPLFDQVEASVASFTGDGAYDQDGVSIALAQRHPAAAIIVPHAGVGTPDLRPHRLTPERGWGNCACIPGPCNTAPFAPAWLMLLPSTIRSRSVETTCSEDNLALSSAPAICPSQSAAFRSRRRSATSESSATPLAPAHVAADRRLRPPGPWASARRSKVAASPTLRRRTSAPLVRAEASRSKTPESRSSNAGQ